MLAPKEVLGKARAYLGEVVPDFAALDPKVEEMILAPDSSVWKITFSAHRGENPEAASLADIVRRQRIEKEVAVTADDGNLIAVRTPAPF